MLLKQQFYNTQVFLNSCSDFWSRELLQKIPHEDSTIPWEWGHDLSSLEPKDFVDLSRFELKNPELKNLLSQVQELSHFESAQIQIPNVDKYLWKHIGYKKKHEIECLAAFIHRHFQAKKSPYVLDIAGGKGHLGHILAHHYSIPVKSIDWDKALQAWGRDRYLKNQRIHSASLSYQQADFRKESIKLHQSKNSITCGLHTCGDLALWHLKAFAQGQAYQFINFGCCYHRMQANQSSLISQASRQYPLPITAQALTLASRSPNESEACIRNAWMVKRYRFLMHYLLTKEFGHQDMQTLGPSPFKIYRLPFADYAQVQAKRLGLKVSSQLAQLIEKDCTPQVEKLLRINQIRNRLARPLEAYLLLDRALFLEELHFNVKILSFFDVQISPRNLGIVADRSG